MTLNSLVRNSKALINRKIRPHLVANLKAAGYSLPDPLWFQDVAPLEEPSLRYESRVDAGSILRAGIEQFSKADPEVLKCLILTLACGLRRSEADTLTWGQLDLKRQQITIMGTEHKRLKSRKSAGLIALDGPITELLLGLNPGEPGDFVLATPRTLRKSRAAIKSRGYRANSTHKRLLEWLRTQGVPSLHPLHTLRKEVGAVIATEQGIYAASRFLRHGDIGITAKLYADLKAPITSGLGSLIGPENTKVVVGAFSKEPAESKKRPATKKQNRP